LPEADAPAPNTPAAGVVASGAETVVAALDTAAPALSPEAADTVARVVAQREATAAHRWIDDQPVVNALISLNYLSDTGSPSEASVDEAINVFSIDERFALPISPDALRERLDAALARSDALPVCAEDQPDTLCEIP